MAPKRKASELEEDNEDQGSASASGTSPTPPKKVRMMAWNIRSDKSVDGWTKILNDLHDNGVDLVALTEASSTSKSNIAAALKKSKWEDGARVYGPFAERSPQEARTVLGNTADSAGSNKAYIFVTAKTLKIGDPPPPRATAKAELEEFATSSEDSTAFLKNTNAYKKRIENRERIAKKNSTEAASSTATRRSSRISKPTIKDGRLPMFGLKVPVHKTVKFGETTLFNITNHHADEGGGKLLALPSNQMALIRLGGGVPDRTVMTGDMNLDRTAAQSLYVTEAGASHFVAGPDSGGDDWTHTAAKNIKIESATKGNNDLTNLAVRLRKESDHNPSFVDITL